MFAQGYRPPNHFPEFDTRAREDFLEARRLNLPAGNTGQRMRRLASAQFSQRHPSFLSGDPHSAAKLTAQPRCSTAQRNFIYGELGYTGVNSNAAHLGYERCNLLRSMSNPVMPMREVWRMRQQDTPSLPHISPPLPITSECIPNHSAEKSETRICTEATIAEAALVSRPAYQQVVRESFWRPQAPKHGLPTSESTRFANNLIGTKMENSMRRIVQRR